MRAIGTRDRRSPRTDRRRDIRPILSENCYFVTGRTRTEADLRSINGGGAEFRIVRRPDENGSVRRISDSEDERMPPAESRKRLTDAQKSCCAMDRSARHNPLGLQAAIARAAIYQDPSWENNEIDAFVLNGLEKR
jgi:hypothetical protein